MQVKLLRVIQEREVQRLGATTSKPVNIRIIAATTVTCAMKLLPAVFAKDLYYRLDVVALEITAAGERKNDIRYSPIISCANMSCA